MLLQIKRLALRPLPRLFGPLRKVHMLSGVPQPCQALVVLVASKRVARAEG